MPENKIKLLVFIPELKHGGAEKFILNLMAKLDKKFKIMICCIGEYNLEFVDHYTKGHLEIIYLNSSLKFSILKIFKLIKEIKPDIVFANLWALNIIVSLCKFFLRNKFKLVLREGNPYLKIINYKIPFFIVKLLISFSYLIADVIIAGSTKGLQNHVEEFSIFNIKKKLTHINNGIDLKNTHSKKILKKYKSDCLRLLCISNLRNQKDHKTILRAVKELNKTNKIRLTIVGEGDELQNLKLFTKKLNIEELVHFELANNLLDRFYFENDIFLFSSFYEGGPNVLLEALQYDIPIIASDCKYGPSEFLNFGEFGDLFQVGDYIMLAKLIKQNILRNVNMKKRSKWIENFDRSKTITKYNNLFSNLVS